MASELQSVDGGGGVAAEAKSATSPSVVEAASLPFEHDKYPMMTGAVTVAYCPRCGFPPDFCDFGSSWDVCKTVALSEYPQYYTQAFKRSGGVATADATVQASNGATTDNSASSAKQTDSVLKGAPAVKSKKKPGAQPASPQITIQRVSRAKHKMATVICGLDAFGIKLENAARLFKKQFACGSSAVKGLPGQQDHVEIQGDFEDHVDDLLLLHFPQIPESALVHLRAK